MKKFFTLFAALACVMSMSAVTYNVTVPAGTKACYIAGEMNSWSFTEMTKVDDTHYTLDLPTATEAMKYKYCSGPGWAYVEKDASGNEIGDRTYSAADVVKKWASVYEPSATPEEPKEEKDITVKAKVPAAWTKTITAWVWPTGGEGKEVTPTKEGDWYVYTHHCAELNIIFKNGAGWNGDANQTVDMKFSESTCIEIKAGSGKATYTVIDCEGGENPGDTTVTPEPTIGVTYNVTVPAGTNACYIAGELNGWSHQEMTKVDDTHYTLTVADATTAMKYKYCSGPDWAYVEMQADGVTDVQDRTYSANDVVEAWKAVYNPNSSDTPQPETGVIYNVTVPVGTNACYIAGEMNGWSQQEMTKVDDTHYTITIATATTAMKYKYCSGPSWDYVEMQADGATDVQDRTYSANDVVESWKAVYNPNGSENPDPTPEPKDIIVKAKMPSHWTETITAWVWETGKEGEVVIPTKDNDWYVVSAHCSALNVIFRNGTDWSTKSNQTEDITLLESACIQIDQVDTLLATYTQIDCEGSILPSDTIEVYTIAGVTSLVGVNWDPTATINDMTKQEDGTYTLLKENLKLVADMPYEYKVVKNHAWDIWSLPGWNMGNDTLLVEKSGLYDVTFTLNLVDTILTAVAHLKEELVLVPVVQLAGNMTDWAENAIEMTLSTDSLSASTTISLLADSLYTFKVIVDGNWKGYNGMITRANSTDLVFNSEVNCGLLTDVAGEYTITWVFATSSVSVVYPENNIPLPEPKDIAVKAKMPSHWTETITAWVWETGKEGEVVIPTKDDDWYVVSAHCSALNVIFRNGTDWNGDANQTVNITLMDSACIVLSQSDTTKATYTIVDCETSEPLPEPKGVTYSVTVPAGTNACYIAGEMNNWSHIEMTKVDDTHYTLTVDTATASMKYKYCSGPSWDYVEMQADGVTDVQDRTYSANDVVEAWKAVYDPNGSENPDPNPEPKDIMVKAKMPEGWTNTITAWVWPTGGEGKEVTPTKEGDWYVYTHHCAELNIIFKNGAGWNGDANQTVDMKFSESTCIEIKAGEGKATYTIVDCETTDIEGVHVSNNVTKFIQDGQLVILFDGVLYNVYGQVVK